MGVASLAINTLRAAAVVRERPRQPATCCVHGMSMGLRPCCTSVPPDQRVRACAAWRACARSDLVYSDGYKPNTHTDLLHTLAASEAGALILQDDCGMNPRTSPYGKVCTAAWTSMVRAGLIANASARRGYFGAAGERGWCIGVRSSAPATRLTPA